MKEANNSRNGDPPQPAELLRDLEQLAARAPDDNLRYQLLKLRSEVGSPEMMALAAKAERWRARREPTLRFVHTFIPLGLILLFCCGAALGLLLFLASHFSPHGAWIDGSVFVGICLAAAGACFGLSRVGYFRVIYHAGVLSTQSFTRRWSALRTGSMQIKDVRLLRERPGDRILEIHGASGDLLEVPMCLENYEALHRFLSHMVRLHGVWRPENALRERSGRVRHEADDQSAESAQKSDK